MGPRFARRTSVAALVVWLLVLAPVPMARAEPGPEGPPRLTAASAILTDASDGKVLYEKNMHQRRAIASTTKIITALVVLDKAKLDDTVTATADAEAVGSGDPLVTELDLKTGEHLTVEQLLYGLLLPSANDAAVALADHVAGSVERFAGLMNAEAGKLGAKDSHFVNANGLDQPGGFSSAFDLALFAREAMRREPFRRIVSTRDFQIPWEGHPQPRALHNRNLLLGAFPGADGVKTGQTKEAGKTLVASATRGNERRISVVLESSDPAHESTVLLGFGFDSFKRASVTVRGKTWGTSTYGDGVTVDIVALRSVSVLIPDGGPAPRITFSQDKSAIVVATKDARQIVKTRLACISGCAVQAPLTLGPAMRALWWLLSPFARAMKH